MAGARIERVGSIFKRVEGLYKGNALRKEDLPIWFNVYKAFPPHMEPQVNRIVPDQTVKNIVYAEDFIRRDFSQRFSSRGQPWDFIGVSSSSKETDMNKYVRYFVDFALKYEDLNSDQIRQKVLQALKADGINLEPRVKE